MSVRILALDTTGEYGSIALLYGEQLHEEPLHSPGGFGHVIFDQIDRLLSHAGLSVASIDCFAAASGPGAFTGVRVGLAAVKGLAAATSKPVVAVSNLQAVAYFGTMPVRAAILDARRGEAYCGLFDEKLESIEPEVVAPFATWLAALPDVEIEFISPDVTPLEAGLKDTPRAGAVVTSAPRATARAIARIAEQRYEAGLASHPAAVEANYVRRSDAELFWKD